MGESPIEVSPAAVRERKRHSFLVDLFIRLVKEKPLGTVGGIIVLILFFTGIFANLLAPYGMNESHMADRLLGPCKDYLMGTDQMGRDLFSRVIFGARISMIVAFCVSSLSVLVSILIGATSGFIGGKFDIIMQRFVDAWMCFPPLFIMLTVMAVLGPGLLQIIVMMGVFFGIGRSRVVRSAVIGIKENMYVEASRAIGASDTRILIRHILPNVMAPIIILFTVQMGSAILTESSISFLGFGIPPPNPTWGGMLSGAGRKYMLVSPWICLWPGLALSIVVWGINMLGDGMRDILDPRLRGGLGRYSGVKRKMSKQVTESQGLTKE